MAPELGVRVCFGVAPPGARGLVRVFCELGGLAPLEEADAGECVVTRDESVERACGVGATLREIENCVSVGTQLARELAGEAIGAEVDAEVGGDPLRGDARLAQLAAERHLGVQL